MPTYNSEINFYLKKTTTTTKKQNIEIKKAT